MRPAWSFTMYSAHHGLTGDTVKGVLSVAQRNGFGLLNELGCIRVSCPRKELFRNTADQAASDILADNRGAITIWWGPDWADVLVQFRLCSGECADSGELLEVALTIDGVLCDTTAFPEGGLLFNAVRACFLDLCKTFGAVYGYGSSEYIDEEYMRDAATLAAAVAAGRRPTFLSWMNYFSNRLIASIGERALAALDHQQESVNRSGVVVYLCDKQRPWNVDLGVLRRAKEQWCGVGAQDKVDGSEAEKKAGDDTADDQERGDRGMK